MNHPNDDDEGPVPGLAGLDLSREPTRDLWSGIEARIAPRRRANHLTWAAAACVVAGLGAVIGVAVLQAPTTVAPLSVVASQSVAPTMSRHGGGSAAATRTLVKANLKIVADAEKQLERAIVADPHSEYLQNLLVAARQQRRALDERMSQST
jgi:hypothetical protein